MLRKKKELLVEGTQRLRGPELELVIYKEIRDVVMMKIHFSSIFFFILLVAGMAQHPFVLLIPSMIDFLTSAPRYFCFQLFNKKPVF